MAYRQYWLMLADRHLKGPLLGSMVRRIALLTLPAGSARYRPDRISAANEAG
jgi:hypothetical protein